MNSKPLTNNQTRARTATGTALGSGVTTCAPAKITARGDGKFNWVGSDRERTPERIAKAVSFFQKTIQMRKDKTRCPRCGRARGEKFRTCDRCRAGIRKSKLRAKGVAVLKGGEYSNADLAAMVLQMRREMDKMQQRFKVWQKAAHYRRNLHYRTNTMRKEFFKPVNRAEAMDYLAQSNHAFATDEA